MDSVPWVGLEPTPLVSTVRTRASLPGAEVPCPVVFYTTGPVPVHPQLSRRAAASCFGRSIPLSYQGVVARAGLEPALPR